MFKGRSRQDGVSLFGLIFLLVIVGAVAIVGMKVFPTVVEYRAIMNNTKRAVRDGSTPVDIQRAFDRYAAIDDIDSITGKDLDISKGDGSLVASFSYSKKIPLFGPVSLVIDYSGDSKGL